MGGDYAPHVVIEAIQGIELDIRLIGDKAQLVGKVPESKIIHAPNVIEMGESPQLAFKKKDSSIGVGIRLQKEGKIDAFVGAGNTGAYVMFNSLMLGRIKGIRRPALGTFLPSGDTYTFVLDVGAVTDVRAEDLYQFGVMGALFVEGITGKENPRVALLSVGEEKSKGSFLTKEAYKIMQDSKLNFVGNIEGHNILSGIADVVVCDGVVGNVMLKFGESMIEITQSMMKNAMESSFKAKVGSFLLKSYIKEHFSKLNYEKYGGAVLLGTKGVTLICHGRSNAKAIRNAIYTAAKYVRSEVNQHIEQFVQ